MSRKTKELEARIIAVEDRQEYIKNYINDVIVPTYNGLVDACEELEEEIATNGVVRDLRKLEKSVAAVQEGLAGYREYTEEQFDKLQSNGVATAINRLNKEVFKAEKEDTGNILSWSLYRELGIEAPKSPTLAGKVDAIVEHLGLDLKVKPEEVTPSKVIAKKKTVSKKKGNK